jgi:hypothetical protein
MLCGVRPPQRASIIGIVPLTIGSGFNRLSDKAIAAPPAAYCSRDERTNLLLRRFNLRAPEQVKWAGS